MPYIIRQTKRDTYTAFNVYVWVPSTSSHVFVGSFTIHGTDRTDVECYECYQRYLKEIENE